MLYNNFTFEKEWFKEIIKSPVLPLTFTFMIGLHYLLHVCVCFCLLLYLRVQSCLQQGCTRPRQKPRLCVTSNTLLKSRLMVLKSKDVKLISSSAQTSCPMPECRGCHQRNCTPDFCAPGGSSTDTILTHTESIGIASLQLLIHFTGNSGVDK